MCTKVEKKTTIPAHGVFISETWLMNTCDVFQIWLMNTCNMTWQIWLMNMTHEYLWHTWQIWLMNMTHEYLWQIWLMNMTHEYMWREVSTMYTWHVTWRRWLMNTCDMTCLQCTPVCDVLHMALIDLSRDSSIRATWRIYTCMPPWMKQRLLQSVHTTMTHSYVPWLIHSWHMTHPSLWHGTSTMKQRLLQSRIHEHDLFIYATWLIHIWRMTHLSLWHDASICTPVCAAAHTCTAVHETKTTTHDPFIYATWLIHLWDMTHVYVYRGTHIYIYIYM